MPFVNKYDAKFYVDRKFFKKKDSKKENERKGCC